MGVKVTFRVLLPTGRIVPTAGLYAKVPGTLAVAFSCVELRGVPDAMGAGVGHVTAGLALLTVSRVDEVAVM